MFHRHLPYANTKHIKFDFRLYSFYGKLSKSYLSTVRNWSTKTTRILTGAVAKQITSDLREELLLTRRYRLTVDESSDEDDKGPSAIKFRPN